MALILFIDDDTLTLQMMQQAAQMVGHQAITTSDCASALKLSVENRPDLIFLDLNLQGTSGFEIMQELRSQEATAGIPVIFLTAEAKQNIPEDILANGAQAYLSKPLRLNTLIEMIREYTDTRG